MNRLDRRGIREQHVAWNCAEILDKTHQRRAASLDRILVREELAKVGLNPAEIPAP